MTRPEFSEKLHPVETGKFLLPTPATLELSDKIDEWFDASLPGGLATGPSRFGKTWGIKRLCKTKRGSAYPVSIDLLHDGGLTRNQFFARLLTQAGHADSQSGTSTQKIDRFLNLLHMFIETQDNHRLLLFFDEAQCLGEREWGWMCDVYNDLDKGDGQVLFVLVGEPSLASQQDNPFMPQVLGRFMTATFEFYGVRNSAEIAVCLAEFDQAHYPEDKEWTYSQEYFPEMFAAKWRLEDEADLLFQAFEEVFAKSGSETEFLIPIQYFIHAVRLGLKTYSCKNSAFRGFSLGMWKDAVERTAYKTAWRFQQPVETIAA